MKWGFHLFINQSSYLYIFSEDLISSFINPLTTTSSVRTLPPHSSILLPLHLQWGPYLLIHQSSYHYIFSEDLISSFINPLTSTSSVRTSFSRLRFLMSFCSRASTADTLSSDLTSSSHSWSLDWNHKIIKSHQFIIMMLHFFPSQ